MSILVTGGGGFLGGAIVRALLGRGESVRIFARGAYPELEAAGAEVYRGDLGDADAVRAAAEGSQAVMHVAAKAGVWGPWQDYYRTNVLGTKHVLAACAALGIKRLVYTSSPSVVFHGHDEEGVDETVPYPDHYLAHYPKTKAMAERDVLRANGPALATVALRPHLIWGPGDPHLVPRIIAQGKAGKLRQVGRRANRVDSVYIDNAAAAHINALDRLEAHAPIAGKVYFITNGEPMPIMELINGILAAAGVLPVTRTVPASAAYAAGAVFETVYRLFRLPGEPRMTRFVARQLSTAHYFDISSAKRDLGYVPAVSIQEGLTRLAESIQSGAYAPV